MKTRSTEAKDGNDARSTSEEREKDCVISPNYIAVLAILNTIVQRVANSLPRIREATQMLPDDSALLDTRDKLGRCRASR